MSTVLMLSTFADSAHCKLDVFKRFYYWAIRSESLNEKQLIKIFKVHTAAAAITVN